MAAHRYWRIYVTASNGTTWHQAGSEMQMATILGGANVCTGGTAISSGDESSFPASNLFDGSTTNFHQWLGSTLPKWVGYDFGAGNAKDIVELRMRSHADWIDRMPSAFQFQYSDDGSTWTTLWTMNGQGGNWSAAAYTAFTGDMRYDDPGITARFWRVRATAAQAGNIFAAREIKMFLTGSSVNQCTGGSIFCSGVAGSAYPPSFAFDGNAGVSDNFWASAATLPTTAQWIGYKFSSAKSIASLAFTARDDLNQAPKDFVIEYWDGATFQTMATVTGAPAWANSETRTYSWAAPAVASARPQVFVCT